MIYGFSGMEVRFDRPAGFNLHSRVVVPEPVSMARRYASVFSSAVGAMMRVGCGRYLVQLKLLRDVKERLRMSFSAVQLV
jgi:hypothetical protein